MDERVTDYRRYWVPLEGGVVAGFEPDGIGGMTLIGLVFYRPTTEALRGARLRDLERLPRAEIVSGIRQQAPPSEEDAAAWRRKRGDVLETFDREYRAWAVAEVARTATPEALARRAGEDPEAFYQRVALAHWSLARVTERPTTELASRAGVKKGTAAMWVSRAKERGLFETDRLYPIEEETK